ncbi:MAG: GlxA family transcriptional regulator [Syntrophobacteraceae bacterium]|nr:GlxA family transcriptional regulator [Syntrophobacteraceae bacterium]
MESNPGVAQKHGAAKVRYIVLLAVPPAMELDIAGPMAVFDAVNRMDGVGLRQYETELVTTGTELKVEGLSGLCMAANRHYRDVRKEVDTLLVVGGTGARTTGDAALLAWLREIAVRVRRLGSVCTGAFLLAEAGLLDGKRATTHWACAQELASRYPRVTVDSNPIWVRDGNVYTSAGVTTGMDLALGFVEEDLGGEVALAAARGLVLFLRRPGGQAQFSVSLSTQAVRKSSLFELQVWMVENLDRDLSVEGLAARIAMSPRNFARSFVRQLGITPARYVEQLRLEAARRRLEQTEMSLEEIASACGFGSAEIMRRAFVRCLGIAPARYRGHFGYSAARTSPARLQ